MDHPDEKTRLPTGVVTFLFTDIEGSTRLLQELGDRYRALLSEHDTLMREAIRRHGGVEVGTEGDAFFAVFTSPQAALSAATDMQRALASNAWPDGSVVRVRMGLHTGAGLLGGDNYMGLDVHFAARIAAAANGGQVLVSEATRSLADENGHDGIGFRDLGTFRLKDFDVPAHIYQLLGNGLAEAFPPPRAPRPGKLPTPRTSFVGRGPVLDELRAMLAATRLLVLTGPGGTGKTRLGVELARSVTDRYGDGVFFVPLETITDVRSIPPTILEVLEVAPGTAPPEEALVDALADKQLLLVLDNLEQIPGVGDTVDELLRIGPGLEVVATSRQALRLYGEQEYPVPPLALPDVGAAGSEDAVAASEGLRLFEERARASRPEFRITADDAPVVAEICRRVDGLPLAIELAAGRMRMLTPRAILERLDQRLTLLEAHAPNLPPRQRSIRGAIEWSYELLGPAEQRLMNRSGIFVGGWDLRAAEAVCGPDAGVDVLDGIESLLDESLVVRSDEGATPRFHLLQTIHEYTRERLSAAGEQQTMARRHAEYFRTVVEEAEPEFLGADPGGCVARLAPDLDNIRAALGWTIEAQEPELGLRIAAAGWRLWQLRGQLSEGRRHLEAVLAIPGADQATLFRARALTALGGIMYWQTDPRVRDVYEEALTLYESLGDEAGAAESLSNLGYAALTGSPPDPQRALDRFLESLGHYESLGDEQMVASLTGAAGYAQMSLGRSEEALETLERALALNTAGGYRGRAADSRFALGNLHLTQGRHGPSGVMYRVALSDAVDMEDAARTLTYLTAVASWAAETGRLHEAVRLAGAIRRAAREQGGTLSGGAVGVDPVTMAREAGMTEAATDTETAAGERLDIRQAIELAFELLASSAAADSESVSNRSS
jgi:predicted ATPase/class 3 adenylate cyclase